MSRAGIASPSVVQPETLPAPLIRLPCFGRDAAAALPKWSGPCWTALQCDDDAGDDGEEAVVSLLLPCQVFRRRTCLEWSARHQRPRRMDQTARTVVVAPSSSTTGLGQPACCADKVPSDAMRAGLLPSAQLTFTFTCTCLPSAPSRAMSQPRDPRLRSPQFLICLTLLLLQPARCPGPARCI